ncbi:MAG TPA: hypothetical protein VH138_09645 [Vicinamibacterales bacterium]|nr:hypothetical protein [Vicinamibacterales bacterium]
MRVGMAAIWIALFFVVMQGFVLPPDGFMCGDQGAKYLQTRAFADHGPLNPSIDVRSRDIDPDFTHQEPKLKNRRGRLVSEFLWLMPLLGSPFLALFGLRGLYVVPAVSALVVFFCAARLARRRDDPNGALTALFVLLVTPIAVYGLELWEHAPAAACVMVIAVLLLPADDAPGRGRLFAAGVVSIAAFLFREEAAVALPALFLGRALARDRRPGQTTRPLAFIVEGFWCGLGVIAGLIASAPMNLMMYGSPLPMHLTQDAWEYAKNISYLAVRHDIVTQLFMPMEYPWVYAAALAAGLAASLLAWRHQAPDTRRNLALAVVHAAVSVMLGVAVALPIAHLAAGSRLHEASNVQSAAHGWAFVPALFYLPWLGDQARTPHARYLIVSAVLAILFTTLVVPSTAGAQWSPRFYLQIAPLLALPAIEIAWPPSVARRRWLEAIAVWGARTALAAAIVMIATGIAYLRSAKIQFAGVTHALARFTADGEVVISGVFWVPEVTATLAQERRFLFSWNSAEVPTLAALAVRTGFERFTVVTFPALTHHTAPDAIEVPGAPCRFVRGERQFVLEIRGLFLSRYGCESP